MIRLTTLGTLSVQRDNRPLSAATTQRRRLALLALLAVAGEKGLTREKVIAFLWPESDEQRARHVLAQTLYAVRRDLGDEDVVVGTTELRLNATMIEADVIELDAALDRGDVDRVAALYAAPFLDGFYLSDAPDFERWSEEERARIAERTRSAFERAARDAASRDDHHRA